MWECEVRVTGYSDNGGVYGFVAASAREGEVGIQHLS